MNADEVATQQADALVDRIEVFIRAVILDSTSSDPADSVHRYDERRRLSDALQAALSGSSAPLEEGE